MTMPALPASGSTSWYPWASAVHDRTSGSTVNHVFYVSQGGSDTNDGLSWGSALLTVAAGLTKLGSGAGIVHVGAGTYTESGLAPNGNQTIRGQGRYATTLQLATSGTLVNISSNGNSRVENLGLAFASSAVTGTLLSLQNAFTCDFIDVRISGQKVAGQVGIRFWANAGDSHFFACYIDNLGVGVQNDSTLNHFIGCVFTDNLTAIQGGDATGATPTGGLACTDCTFRGTGNYYVNVTGVSLSWHFKGCWFDGGATTAIQVGTGTYGPWLFSVVDCPALTGATNSLVINACENTELRAITFANTGSFPTELAVTAANCPAGSIGALKSVQGTHLETKVPARWLGAVGYTSSTDNTVSLVETATWMGVANFPMSYKRIVVKIVNRATSAVAVTLTFPTAFETSFGGGQFYKTFDNTAIGAGLTFTATSITVPTGIAVTSGLVIIEGF